ncbi:sensor histidine kinase [Sorangium sp. So ce131]|uniref:sensor histidine kinase n=1 Tax=Sorangium sp. So ce131 TaxID=3133282 RepID=UPI003F5EE542
MQESDPPEPTARRTASPFLAGDSEMALLMRELDWSTTPVGPVERWPQSLRTAVSICLASRHPIEIWWGPEYARFYNDAYRPILGANKHPQFLGRPGRECWSEIWHVIGPMLDGVRATGQATWSEDFQLILSRNDYPEETYFTFSYAPVLIEDGTIGGIFCACAETTARVLSERRLRALRALGAQPAAAETVPVEETCARSLRTLAESAADVAFALLYLVEPGGAAARLIAAEGVPPGGRASPERVSLTEPLEMTEESRVWPLAEVARTRRTVRVGVPAERFGELPGGLWPEPCREALVLPLARSGKSAVQGFLVAGVSPRRALDVDYGSFFELAAGQIATTISDAQAYQEERLRADERAELLAREQAALAEAERQRSRLSTLFMQAPAGICVLRGPEHVYELANPRYVELIGGRDVVGKPLRLALPEAADAVVPLLDRVCATGEPFFGNEFAVSLERGGALEECFFNFIYQPIYDAAGEVEGVAVLAFEVTDQVRARRRAEQLAHALAVTNQDLDQFAYVASHDLKAPLRGIASLSEWIEEGLADKMSDEARQQMRMLRGRVHRLEALIEGILSYSRAGRIRDKVGLVDVGAIVAECAELLGPPAEARIVIGEGMPTLHAERVPVQQVFMHLMGNALKHARRADAVVEVACADAGDFYDFTVKDNGPGIPPQFQERIWGIFQTLEARDKVEGTGIGLSVVKKIVETRGGRVSLDSEVGAGATFHVFWPKRLKTPS